MEKVIDTSVVASQIENLRKRLLDFSTRNDLLNHSHYQRSTKYIRVVDELPNELYSKLVEKKMLFKPLPDVDSEPKDEQDPDFLSFLEMEKLTNEAYQKKIAELGTGLFDEEKLQQVDRELKDEVRAARGMPQIKKGKSINLTDHAKVHGFDPSFDLPTPSAAIATEHSDDYIQTLFLPDGLDRRLRSLYSKHQQFLSDTGINVLRAAFGFLEWYEDKNSDKPLHAPLLMLPLSMERVSSRGGARFYVSSAGAEAELNQTLAERLRAMDIELPDFDENDNPELYFKKIVPLIESKPKWRIRRFVTIGVFPFQKISMYKDLEPSEWPGNSLLENNILATLLGGLESGSSYGVALDEYDIDALSIRGEAPPIYMSADSSQHSAIVDALQGKNLVIQGPPGTGKSQTIANIIAAALHNKKSVLFVAEKQAALNVVASRLRAVGLGPCLLDLHKRNDKTSMHSSIQESMEARLANKEPDKKNERGTLKYHLEKFGKHKTMLHSKTGFANLSGYELLWKYINLKAQVSENYQTGEFEFDYEEELTEEILNANLDLIRAKINDEVAPEIRLKAEKLADIVNVANPILIEEIKSKSAELMNVAARVSSFFDENKTVLSKVFAAGTLAQNISNLVKIGYISDSLSGVSSDNAKHFSLSSGKSISEELLSVQDYSKLTADATAQLEELPTSIDFQSIKEEYSIRELKELHQQLSKKRIFSGLSSELKRAREKGALIGLNPSNDSEASSSLRLLIELLENVKSMERQTPQLSHLSFVDGLNTNQIAISEYISYLELAESVHDELINDGWDDCINLELFSSGEAVAFLSQLETDLLSEEYLSQAIELVEGYLGSIGSDESADEINLDEFTEVCSIILDTSDADLVEIAKLNSVKRIDDSSNISKFLASQKTNALSTDQALKLYQFLEVQARIKKFVTDNIDLFKDLDGTEITNLRRKFNTNDRILMKSDAEHLLHQILKNQIPQGNSKGLKSSFSEFSLLKNEMSKKARFIPIRDLVRRASKALTAMKPVWMMSPLAISQFLQKRPGQFDILIIDEASQMKPEDALPAVLRAKQLIVVGDNQQLPPTSFFDSALEATDFDDEEDVQQESILDLAADRLADTRTLRWHYRSRHPDLIRFSNKRFYDNKLLVFPSPNPKAADMGIKYVEANGTYQSSLNQREAERVVEEAITQMTNHPEKSMAIVAMNVKQKEYIRELFEYQLSNNSAVSDYYDNWKESELEPFIIRNLESIQGDERDVIIVSTVYGPNEQGHVRQDFGPINRYYGPRRLNVLFSRAKEKLILVTSLRPGDIKLEAAQNQKGKAALQEYISFASTGILDVGEDLEREPDSDFEIAVINQLKDHGFEAVPQVGVEGFRIDIGVRHPEFPYGFIAGVECDGASYHSSKSARDRDKIRQDILEGLGWKIYRIWSTDWFQDSEKETQKMIEQLEFFKQAALAHLQKTRGEKSSGSKKKEKSDDKVVQLSKVKEDHVSAENAVKEDEVTSTQEPFGRRRELEYDGNTIVYYEDNAEYFEIWEDGQIIGEIEKKGVTSQRAVLYGGTIQGIQKPRYECELLVPASVSKTFDDIFVSLKWVYDSYKQHRGEK